MRVHDTVRTKKLGRKEFIADKANKALRRPDARGVISGILGRQELRYLVLHEGETTPAVYLEEELEREHNAYWRVTYSQYGRSYFVELATYRTAEEFQAEMEGDNAKNVTIEGPFYSDKELTEGLLPPRTLFDHLKEKD